MSCIEVINVTIVSPKEKKRYPENAFWHYKRKQNCTKKFFLTSKNLKERKKWKKFQEHTSFFFGFKFEKKINKHESYNQGNTILTLLGGLLSERYSQITTEV